MALRQREIPLLQPAKFGLRSGSSSLLLDSLDIGSNPRVDRTTRDLHSQRGSAERAVHDGNVVRHIQVCATGWARQSDNSGHSTPCASRCGGARYSVGHHAAVVGVRTRT